MANDSCCDLGIIESVVDYSTHLGSAQNFLERAGIVPTYRNDTPRIEPRALRVHEAPVEPPLPLPNLQRPLNGKYPPDRARTYDWPHPNFEE